MPDNYDIGLPEFDVIDRKESSAGDYVYVLKLKDELKAQYKICPQCGARMHVHKKSVRKIRDLNERGHNVGLAIQTARYRCSNKDCGYICSEEYPSIDSGKMTIRLRESIKEDAFLAPFKEVADKYALSVPTVALLFKEKADELRQEAEVYAPRVLGIDEVHLDRKYYGVFVDIERHSIIEITKSRSKATVKSYINSLPNKENIIAVTMDMWAQYRDAVHDTLPGIPVVVDKFHVIKELNVQMDAVRASISNDIREREARTALKNNRFLLLKGTENLTPLQVQKLRELLEKYPKFSDPYDMKEIFRAIYLSESRAEAEATYEEWVRILHDEKHLTCFDNFINTVNRWHTEIFNYFDYPYTNAQTESMNNRIREIDGAGRGYSFEVLRDKMVLRPYVARRSGAVDFSVLDEDD